MAVSQLWSAAPLYFFLSIMLTTLGGLAMAALLFTTGQWVSGLDQHDASAWLVAAITLLCVLYLTQALAPPAQRILAEKAMKAAGVRTLRAAAGTPLSSFDSSEFHDRLSTTTRNPMALLSLAMSIPPLVGGAVGSLALAVALATTSPLLLLLTLLSLVPGIVLASRIGDDLFMFNFGSSTNDRSRSKLANSIYGRESAAEIRSLAIADFLISAWDRSYDQRIDEISRLSARHARLAGVAALLSAAAVSLVAGAAAWMSSKDQISAGQVLTAIAAAVAIGQRGAGIASSVANIREHSGYFKQLELLEADVHDARGTTSLERLARLELDRVSFKYPNSSAAAVAEVSLSVEHGQMIAIVGENGSGKTTLAKIMSGLYLPQSGALRWNGAEIPGYASVSGSPEAVLIPQEFGKYWMNVRENVTLGFNPESSDERLDDAIDLSGARAMVEALPAGLATLLSAELPDGVDLSGGQWQRIALARAFYRNPSLVILDEPTSALDAKGEQEFFESLRTLRADCSMVVISHRFSTVKDASVILVMDRGRLVEVGSHDELMSLGGKYAAMFSAQAASYQLTQSK
jgi:ATP-binding cassette subfamily B protein